MTRDGPPARGAASLHQPGGAALARRRSGCRRRRAARERRFRRQRRGALVAASAPSPRPRARRPRLNPKKAAEGEFETTRRGSRLATSVGGTLTGRGGKVLIGPAGDGSHDPRPVGNPPRDRASSGSLIGRPARYPPIFSDAFWTMVPDRNEEPIEKSDGLQGIEAHFTG
jgi:hypothetical protein